MEPPTISITVSKPCKLAHGHCSLAYCSISALDDVDEEWTRTRGNYFCGIKLVCQCFILSWRYIMSRVLQVPISSMAILAGNRPIDYAWVSSLDHTMGNPPNQADHRMVVLTNGPSEEAIQDPQLGPMHASPKFKYYILSGQHRWQVALRRIAANRLPPNYAWEAEIYSQRNCSLLFLLTSYQLTCVCVCAPQEMMDDHPVMTCHVMNTKNIPPMIKSNSPLHVLQYANLLVHQDTLSNKQREHLITQYFISDPSLRTIQQACSNHLLLKGAALVSQFPGLHSTLTSNKLKNCTQAGAASVGWLKSSSVPCVADLFSSYMVHFSIACTSKCPLHVVAGPACGQWMPARHWDPCLQRGTD